MYGDPRSTEALIDRLTEHARPVRPLAPVPYRVGVWVLVAFGFAAAMVWAISPRPDLQERLNDMRFVTEQMGALLTAIAAAIAALTLTIPGLSRGWRFLPLVPGLAWLGTLLSNFLSDQRHATQPLQLTPDMQCFFLIALIGSLPVVVLVSMLRQGAPLAPRLTVAMATLAAGALGNFALRFFHMQDEALMILVWQVGSVAALALLAVPFGHRLLAWDTPAHS